MSPSDASDRVDKVRRPESLQEHSKTEEDCSATSERLDRLDSSCGPRKSRPRS